MSMEKATLSKEKRPSLEKNMHDSAEESFAASMHAMMEPARIAKVPSAWEMIPDIGLYMDQVLSWLEQEVGPYVSAGAPAASRSSREKIITPSMINNYIKGGIIPRTAGKKYSRDHLARLLVTCMLKNVLSLPDLALLLQSQPANSDFSAFYGVFRETLAVSLRDTAQSIEQAIPHAGVPLGEQDAATVRSLALKCAVEACVRSLAAEKLLHVAETVSAQERH